MSDLNPICIQYSERHGSKVPLFLVHDGGGTVFHYFALGELHRNVYGIQNTYFDTGEPWQGGIDEMARAYADIIKATVPRGPVILGGWSLGGLLSLAISHVLADDPNIHVIGLVLVDSRYPRKAIDGAGKTSRPDRSPYFGPTTKPEMKERVLMCFREARRMIDEWTPPAFSSPPGVLLRATENEPGDDEPRDSDGMLGWSEYPRPFLKPVVDIPGHHFSVFEHKNLENMTKLMDDACRDFENAHKRAT